MCGANFYLVWYVNVLFMKWMDSLLQNGEHQIIRFIIFGWNVCAYSYSSLGVRVQLLAFISIWWIYIFFPSFQLSNKKHSKIQINARCLTTFKSIICTLLKKRKISIPIDVEVLWRKKIISFVFLCRASVSARHCFRCSGFETVQNFFWFQCCWKWKGFLFVAY